MSKALVFVELDINYCSLIHNVAPCLAALEGEVLASLSYHFANSTRSFTTEQATFSSSAEYSTFTETSGDPKLLSPSGLTIDGSVDSIIRIDIERITDRSSGAWDGVVFYTTGGHGFSASYYKNFSEITIAQGRQTIEIDMAALTAGGTDWTTNTITRLRFDFDNGTGGVFRIYSIQVGHYATVDDATGTRRCFNTRATCQDLANLTVEPVTLRFAQGTSYLAESGIDAIPCIENIAFTPGTISLGEDLGTRSSLQITMSDFHWSDTGQGFDKYLSERGYNPYLQGTFWGKFRARHPSLRGLEIRIIRGFLGDAIGDMETRHYIVDRIDGPGRDGTYQIVAKDALKLLDGNRAQAPRMSNGFLSAGIDDNDLSLTLSPAGIGDLEYPSGSPTDYYVAIGGKEIVKVTARSGDVLTIVRAQYNTVAVAHSSTDRVQLCIEYLSADPADIISDLLENYAAVPASYIPLSSWQLETSSYLRTLYSALIAEPTAVETLVKELIRQSALAIWWDDVDRLIQLRVLRKIDTEVALFDENVIMADSFSVADQPDKRLSQVWTYFGQDNPLKKVEDTDNYRSCSVVANLELEDDYGSPAIDKIYSRWIPEGGRAVAERIGEILVGRYGRPPRKFRLNAFRNGPAIPYPAIGCEISWFTLQDDTGARIQVPAQVTRLDPQSDKYAVEAEEFDFTFVDDGDPTVIYELDDYNVNCRDTFDLFYPEPVSGDDVYIIVSEGVTIGSTSTSNPAMTLGSWPAGVNVFVINRGRIQGKGGAGGAGVIFPVSPNAGQNGGVAIYTRFDISLDNDAGEIFGGGGGGGSGGVNFIFAIASSGGGGGAGTDGGAGGSAFAPEGAENPTQAGNPGTADDGGTGGTILSAGGDGGDPGQNGTAGANSGGAGGSAGAAIDGDSYVTITVTGDIRGPQIN